MTTPNLRRVFINDTADGLGATLTVNGVPQSLAGATVVSRTRLGSAPSTDTSMTIVSAVEGTVRRDWGAGEVTTTGQLAVEFIVTFADGTIATWPSADEDAAVITFAARRILAP